MSILGDSLRSATGIVRRVSHPVSRRLSQAAVTAQAGLTRRHLDERRRSLSSAVAGAAPPPPVQHSVAVIVYATGGPPRRLPVTAGSVDAVVSVTLAPRAEGPSVGERINALVESLDTDIVCVVADSSAPMDEHWIDHLAAAVAQGAEAATPLFVHPERSRRAATPDDLLIRRSGVELTERDGGPVAEALDAGLSPASSRPMRTVDAATSACLALDRSRFLRVGGFPPVDDLDAAAVELCVRLRALGGTIVSVPAALVVDHRKVRSRQEMRHPFDPAGDTWRELVGRVGPLMLRPERVATDPLSIAICIGAPNLRAAARWGDWHLAHAFARALERLGHRVLVQSLGEVDGPASRACDIQLVLRGKSAVRRTIGQRHVLWVISHPDSLRSAECDEADLVLVASRPFADALRTETATPVEELLQATDPALFHPRAPEPRWAYPLAIVANARHVMRHGVADALAAGLRPAVIGRGWDRLIDPALIVAHQVPNADLATVYSSVGVLLNDHWEDMQRNGFVSNRIFDALACATPLISDAMGELGEMFGEAVMTYESPPELRQLVEGALQSPSSARRKAEAGRAEVLAHHTFDHRARAFLAALHHHGLALPPPAMA